MRLHRVRIIPSFVFRLLYLTRNQTPNQTGGIFGAVVSQSLIIAQVAIGLGPLGRPNV